MSLVDQLKDQMKEAMRAKDKVRLGTIRMALAAIKQIEVDNRETLNDDQAIAVLTKMVKQRRDSIAQYEAAGRDELAQAEAGEIRVLETFLPKPLSEEEVAELVDATIQEVGASSMADMGKVMGALKPKVQGRADMASIGALIKAKLK
ncbi:GatB/YqeY domain-containing protein [Shewanella loihica]|uniref:GatB/Yqey domain protein n=1 Tax=Shewanella loihica (strain ATCC BAA-1088 / PV-4) TaxID=323850 RepID=A3QBM1_SHELP|nr:MULTISPECIES: GatB/YqeY domain-containing protein [Shewanella]ABO22869.1 GatB/Yqey domain protein [Shewanella loihica PV-4]QYJ83383.1 GatB/YqeY domain-containing protein [Shewanella aegiceratis]QYJ94751.1 GatB/YqeY domain-containing protein [Shewanella spartinae]QYJ98598.1 GatB/YqeY domain-containing protein [Shewanella alkalitolerans]QYK13889.1 GatB/YqeY domain-containing protein [Shewanella rhizosphaerae]